MSSLQDLVRAQGNDYSALEHAYRSTVGEALVDEPFRSFVASPSMLTRSASVLIGSHNSRVTLEKSLLSIAGCSLNRAHPELLEVIVVDDGSTDGTWEMLRALELDLRLQCVRQERRGLTAAHNTAASFSEADVLIFADSDMVHLPFALEELMKRHQVLDDVLLLGFRRDVDPGDAQLERQALLDALSRVVPDFSHDFRLSFPGRPSNICRDTEHLKALGQGRTVRMANGASYNLCAMVVGAFFSIERSDYLDTGGSDERLTGWGCEDSLIGARALALGNKVIPVYSATSLHLSHPSRDPAQGAQFARNLEVIARILEEEFAPEPAATSSFRRRALEHFIPARVAPRQPPATPGPEYPLAAAAHSEWGDYHFTLGHWERARTSYQDAVAEGEEPLAAMLGVARSELSMWRVEESLAAFEACLEIDPSALQTRFESCFALARAGRFAEARHAIDVAGNLFEREWAMGQSSGDHKRRGNHHASQELHRIALDDFDLALILDPATPWTHFDRAVSLHKLNHLDEALSAALEADRLLHPQDGNRTWLHAEIGDLCAAMGDPNRAKVELERAVDLHPGNFRAAEALARLDRGDADWLEVRCPDAVKKAARAIPGWLASEEMDLLAACVDRAPSLERRQTGAVLELGSHCGRSTVVIAGALRRSRRSDLRFSAVDPHEGTEPGGESTLESLLCSLRDLSLERWASVIVGRSQEVAWRSPIAFLFIDAMHDYQNVSADFRRFSEYVVTGGLVAFHDYSRYFPDVRRLVDEVLLERDFRFVAQRGHLLVIRRVNPRPSS